jgi:hypothetical protein
VSHRQGPFSRCVPAAFGDAILHELDWVHRRNPTADLDDLNYDLEQIEHDPLTFKVHIVVDADAGTVSTHFDGSERARVYPGFPRGTALRPWARVAAQSPLPRLGSDGRPDDPDDTDFEVSGVDGAESVVFE